MGRSMIQVFDDFLDQDHFEFIQEEMCSSRLPWYYNPDKIYKGDGDIQFTHIFYMDTKQQSGAYDELIYPIVEKLGTNAVIRVKANLTLPEKEVRGTGMHVDFSRCFTAILYITTTDGPTRFNTGEQVDCVANRLVVFPSNMQHEGCIHTTPGPRIVLNFNYHPEYPCEKPLGWNDD
jgi:hypothetical protein